MPQPRTADLSTIDAHLVLVSDRVLAGAKEDRTTGPCAERLRARGVREVRVTLSAESREAIHEALRSALDAGARIVLVLGASGFGAGNVAPEVVREVVEVEIPGLAEQIRAHGLTHTPLAGLSREVVGVTARDSSGALVVASPGSPGGASDTLDVLEPLLGAILAQLDEER